MSQAKENLNIDLGVAMSEIRQILLHYGLGKWQEYLVVREPGKVESFIVKGQNVDNGNFALNLIELHKERARIESAPEGEM